MTHSRALSHAGLYIRRRRTRISAPLSRKLSIQTRSLSLERLASPLPCRLQVANLKAQLADLGGQLTRIERLMKIADPMGQYKAR